MYFAYSLLIDIFALKSVNPVGLYGYADIPNTPFEFKEKLHASINNTCDQLRIHYYHHSTNIEVAVSSKLSAMT